MFRFARFAVVVAAIGAAIVGMARPASALTTRHTGASDSDYINLANNTLPQTGAVFGPGWVGSGTLISPTWVLTAGHVADPSATTFSSPAGTRSIIAKHSLGSPDIGLVQLDSPITSVAPIKLYDLFYGVEDGQAAMIAGAGNTGTGLTGQQGGAGTPRAGYTNVYANAGAWGWGDNQLLTWFRSPTGGAHQYEAGSAQGDSGGGLFLNVGGEWAIAGVMSLVWYVNGDPANIGKYDNGGVYPRTALHNDWILARATDAQLIPEPMTAAASSFILLTTCALGRVGHRRRRN